jgi:hypothetical protein
MNQPIYWLHHSFSYGPAIHTESRIQHRCRGRRQQLVVIGRCVDAFERKGHHYIVNDAEILTRLARRSPQSDTAIYRSPSHRNRAQEKIASTVFTACFALMLSGCGPRMRPTHARGVDARWTTGVSPRQQGSRFRYTPYLVHTR